MKPPVERFVESWVRQHAFDSKLVPHILAECPWLDGTSEIAEEIGVELLQSAFGTFALSHPDIVSFLEAYNRFARGESEQSILERDSAYSEMAAALDRYGVESAFGDGDYWLVSDSFSEVAPTVVVFGSFLLPPSALLELATIGSRYQQFTEVLVTGAEGDVLHRLQLHPNGG